MGIDQPVYCTREEVKTALDFKESARNNAQIDRAIIAASRSVDSLCHRKFYPFDDTRKFDWPNYDRAAPWRLYLNENELAAAATTILSGTTNIPIGDVNFEPFNYGPPYSWIELRRDLGDTFGHNTTPQRDVSITGTFGFWTKTQPAGALAAAISDTVGTTITVSNGSITGGVGVGHILLIDSERFLVTDKTMVTSGQTQQSGATTAVMSDRTLNVTDGTKFSIGETLLLDSERMYIVDIASNALTVVRAWDGSTLATHSAATIFANRLCTVTRGDLGSTAATHSNSAPISKYQIPGTAKELAVAEAINNVLQETSGYARTVGSGDNVRNASGSGLADLRDRVYSELGRKARIRVI